MSNPRCNADACRQGRIPCPAPHACRLAEPTDDDYREAATAAERVAILFFPAIVAIVVSVATTLLLLWLFTR
jgi:hypothetical protein